MSNNTLASQARELASQANRLLVGREYFLGDITKRFAQAAEAYPHDQCIRNAERYFSEKLAKEGTLASVSQMDIQSVYDTVAGLGNREAFADELGDLLLEDRNPAKRNYDEYLNGVRDSGDVLNLVDQEKVEALASIFDNRPDAKVLRGTFIDKGRKGVGLELESLGYPDAQIEVAAHDDNFVVYAIELDGKNGRVSFAIPAEISLGSVLLPSTFVVGSEFRDLNKHNLDAFADSHDRGPKTATSKAVLDTLNRWIRKDEPTFTATASSFDDVLPRGPMFYMDHIGHTVQPQDEIDVRVAQVPLPEPLKEIGERLIGETLLESGLSFGREAVVAAKSMVASVIKEAGLLHDRIAVEGEFPGGMTLSTNVGLANKKRIEVAVEVVGKTPLIPGAFVSGGYAGKFNEAGLTTFAKREEGNPFDALLSDKSDLSFVELHKMTLAKTAQGNFIEATEALTVIAEKFGDSYHNLVHGDMMSLLRAGYAEPERPLSAMEVFAKKAAEAATARAEMIRVDSTARMLYPKE